MKSLLCSTVFVLCVMSIGYLPAQDGQADMGKQVQSLDERMQRIEAQLQRIEKLLQTRSSAGEAGTQNELKPLDSKLKKAVERAEEKYGLSNVGNILQGKPEPGKALDQSSAELTRQILTHLYEKGAKAEPDPDLISVLRGFIKMRGAELGRNLAAKGSNARLFSKAEGGGDSSRFSFGGGSRSTAKPVHGKLGDALGGLLVAALQHPALEKVAVGEAHLFPGEAVEVGLLQLLKQIGRDDLTRQRRTLAALAAAGNEKANQDVFDAIRKSKNDTKWLTEIGRKYASSGKPFGLYAMAFAVEKEQQSQAGGGRSFRGGSSYQFIRLTGKSEEQRNRMREKMDALGEDASRDARREVYREATNEVLAEAIDWVKQQKGKLLWVADEKKFIKKF